MDTKTMEKKIYRDVDTFRSKLWKLMLPIALQNLMLSAVAAGDAVMLGRLSQNSMAAVSLATQVQFVQNMILGAFTAGASILGAQYLGKNDTKRINDIFCMTLRVVGGLSILFTVLCVGTPGMLMRVFAGDPELIRIGSLYLRIAGWSYLLTGISQCYQTIMKVTLHVRRVALISSTTVVLNLVLNAVFIFGLFGIAPITAHAVAIQQPQVAAVMSPIHFPDLVVLVADLGQRAGVAVFVPQVASFQMPFE
jgi:Na+-driven multidrug efflux pump